MFRQVTKLFTAVTFLSLVVGIGSAAGQDSDSGELEELQQKVESQKPGNTTFLMRGYAHAGFEVVDEQTSFVSGTFAPIFLWRQSDRILFEAEAEIVYAQEGVDFALEYANLSYILSDYFIVRFGNFLTPFGIFGERLHPNWINRFPTNPLGFDHHNPVGPFAEFGVELRGGAPLGSGQFNYAVYLSNGPLLQVDTSVDPITVNTSYRNIIDNNDSKAIGGRIGLLPLANSSLEVGFSGQYAKIGDRDTGFEDIGSLMYAVDLTFVQNSLSAIKGNIDLKAQWNYVDEDRFQLINATGGITDVDNDKSAYFVQLSYRPALSGSDFISKIELVGRYSALNIINEASYISGGDGHDHTHKAPEDPAPVLSSTEQTAQTVLSAESAATAAMQQAAGGDNSQYAVGINYWLTWRSVLKFSYQVTNNDNDVPGFFIHYALGF